MNAEELVARYNIAQQVIANQAIDIAALQTQLGMVVAERDQAREQLERVATDNHDLGAELTELRARTNDSGAKPKSPTK